VLEDQRLTKYLFRGNLMDNENLARIKKECFKTSLKLSGYGLRHMWMPSKQYQKPKRAKLKAPTRRFDKDGRDITQVEI